MAEEVVVQQETSYADALKSSLNVDYNAAPKEPIVETPAVLPSSDTAPKVDTPAPAEPAPFDPISWFKEQGIQDIDSVDTLKARLTAPAPEPIVKAPDFKNDVSKSIYENLLAGNKKEVREYLQKIELAETIATKSPEEIIKAGWKEDYGLTDAQAERRFNKTYSIADADLMDPEDKEIEQKLIDKQVQKEAEKYKDFFGKYQTDLALPSLQQPVPASAAPEESKEAKQAASYAFELSKSLPTDYSNINYEYKDETSGLSVAGKVEIPAKDIADIKSKFGGYEDKLLASLWFNQDGSPKSENLIAQHIALITNPGKYINAAVSDAVTKTRIELLKENRNHQAPGATVITGDFQPSEAEQKAAWYKKNFM